MIKQIGTIFVIIVLIISDCDGQDMDPWPGYQMAIMNNPAFSGSESDGVLRMSYLNYFPGNNYNLHSVYFSYDSYFPELHGGAGFFLTDDYLGGIVNDLKGGLSYAYFLQAGKDLFFSAGLSASVYHRGYSFNRAVLPDQIDPLGGVSYPSAESLAFTGRTVFDLGAGIVFSSSNVFGGISVSHLAEPDISTESALNEKLKRKILLQLAGDFYPSKGINLKMSPLGYLIYQGGYFSAGTGASIEINSLSFNVLVLPDNRRNINMQTGFSLQTGRICFYYNYRLNLVSGNAYMPFSLIHQTGLAFSLYNVDKRKIIKTINFPKL